MKTNIHKLNGFIYVTSEEKPSIKDWSINLNCKYAHQELCTIDNEIELNSYVNSYENDCKKVILTNDSNLTNVQKLTPEEEAYCKTVDSVGVDSFKLNFGAILYRLQLPKQKEMKATEIKAKELVEKFWLSSLTITEKQAIQCAIICVDEIIKTFDSKNLIYPKEVNFWQEVLTILKEM